MPRATDYLFSFNAGEWSPAAAGRIDLQKRRMALALSTNFVPLVAGALTRRPGTWYVAAAKTNSANVRLVPFIFSNLQSYVLEFGDSYIRFYTEGGQLLNGGSPYEVATTYLGSELQDIGFTQSADVLYIAHQNHAPAKLERLGATDWTLTDIAFQDGPYLDQNVSDTYMSSSASFAGATTTLSINKTDGVNGGAGFLSTDVGRPFRIGTQTTNTDGTTSTQWIWGVITAITDTKHATGVIKTIAPL